MARYNQKRKRSSGRPYASKKRKTFKRRRGGAVTANYTSALTRGQSTGFRGKKVSRRAYKNHLWNSSQFATHYRSIHGSASTMVTPASTVLGSIYLFNMIRHGTNDFWTVAGGLQPHDTGITTALFSGDITVRGGQWRFQIQNLGTTPPEPNSDVRVRAFFFNSVNNPNFTYEPTSGPNLWDPTASPDFINFIGKPYKTLECLIEEGKSWTFGGRIKLQKIDEITYRNQGRSPLIAIIATNVGHAIPLNLAVTRSYNLSFAGNSV